MVDVLLARQGFRDDSQIRRLHREAGLPVEIFPGGLADVVGAESMLARDGLPVCVVFWCPVRNGCADPEIVDALRFARLRYAQVVFVAFIDAALSDSSECTQATVSLLEAGADEILSSWVEPVEYAARLRALARRRCWRLQEAATSSLEMGARPRLDIARRRLLGSGGAQTLTAKECIVMQAILESDGVVTRAFIGERLWTDGWYGTRKAIDMHVSNLRRKLKHSCGDDWRISTVRGAGFMLVPHGQRSERASKLQRFEVEESV